VIPFLANSDGHLMIPESIPDRRIPESTFFSWIRTTRSKQVLFNSSLRKANKLFVRGRNNEYPSFQEQELHQLESIKTWMCIITRFESHILNAKTHGSLKSQAIAVNDWSSVVDSMKWNGRLVPIAANDWTSNQNQFWSFHHSVIDIGGYTLKANEWAFQRALITERTLDPWNETIKIWIKNQTESHSPVDENKQFSSES
jgi:hypothetical protein